MQDLITVDHGADVRGDGTTDGRPEAAVAFTSPPEPRPGLLARYA
jgi:hypothetical protein